MNSLCHLMLRSLSDTFAKCVFQMGMEELFNEQSIHPYYS